MPSHKFKLDGNAAKYLQGRKSMTFISEQPENGVQLGCPVICASPVGQEPCGTCDQLPGLIRLTLPDDISGTVGESRDYSRFIDDTPDKTSYSTSTLFDKWSQLSAGNYVLRQCGCEWKLLQRTGFFTAWHPSYLEDNAGTLDSSDDTIGPEGFDLIEQEVPLQNSCTAPLFSSSDPRGFSPGNIAFERITPSGSFFTYWEVDVNTLDNNFVLSLTDLGGGSVKATVVVFASLMMASSQYVRVTDPSDPRDGMPLYGGSGSGFSLEGPLGGGSDPSPIWRTARGFGPFQQIGTLFQISDRIVYDGIFTCGVGRSVVLSTPGPVSAGSTNVSGTTGLFPEKFLSTNIITSWPETISLNW